MRSTVIMFLRGVVVGVAVMISVYAVLSDLRMTSWPPAAEGSDTGSGGDLARALDHWEPPTAVPNTVGVVTVHSTTGIACSAIPVAGTSYIITAAHCLVDDDRIVQNAAFHIQVDGVAVHNPVETFALPFGYFGEQWAAYDVAVLTTSRPWYYGVDGIGTDGGEVHALDAYGVQSVDDTGSRLTPDDLDALDEVRRHCDDTACLTRLAPPVRAVTKCSIEPSLFGRGAEHVVAPCGLVNGASGGPVIATLSDGRNHLLGVTSTVYTGWRVNGFAAGSVVSALLEGDGMVVAAAPFPHGWDDPTWPRAFTPSAVATLRNT